MPSAQLMSNNDLFMCRYALEGDMYSEDPIEPGTPNQGKILQTEVVKIKFNGRTSSGTASTQLSAQSKN